MPEEHAEKTSYNPFDVTKVWPHAEFPLIDVGVMELNRNPDHYFAEIEQASFSPSNIVPGIGFRPDKDAAGPNLRLCGRPSLSRRHALRGAAGQPSALPDPTYHADGSMRFDSPKGTDALLRAQLLRRPAGRRPAARNRRCGSRAMPTTTITAPAMTTTPRSAHLFSLFDAGQASRLFQNYRRGDAGRAGVHR